jgi:hypothetical protein
MTRRPRHPASTQQAQNSRSGGSGASQRAGGLSPDPIAPTKPLRSKYGNQPVEYDGRRFASKRERDRYHTLKRREQAGEIIGLECQVRFKLSIGSQHICDYIADFRYGIRATGEIVIEDAKGVRTPVYRLKAKLMRACHGIEVQEV